MFYRKLGHKSDKSNKAPQKQQLTTHTTAPQVNGAHPATLIQRAKLNPNSLNTDDVLRLQQTIGNRAATQLLAGRSGQRVQAKLTIGEPGDKYEQEADRVAEQVVNQINAPVSQRAGQNVQREEISEEEKELQMKPMLQLRSGKVGMIAAPEVEASIQQARGGGQPLADSIREPMEQAFGADFSGVKVHTDTQSDQLNRAIQARAFTTGQDVFFRQGEYNPGSRGGQELLAHELTHVVQQKGRVVQRVQQKGTLTSPKKPTEAIAKQVKETAWSSLSIGQQSIQRGPMMSKIKEWKEERRAENLLNGERRIRDYDRAAGMNCYEAAALVLLYQGRITPAEHERLRGNRDGLVQMFDFVNGSVWDGGPIQRGRAIGFYDVGLGRIVHAAISVGQTSIRGVNGGLLGQTWDEVRDLNRILQRRDDGTYEVRNDANLRYRVYISNR